MLDPEEYAAQQDREGAIPIFDANILERPQRTAEAGIIERDIKSAKLGYCTRNRRLYLGFVRNVRALKDRAAAILAAFPDPASPPS